MKSFTMNQNTMNQSTLPHELAHDESGRLYSVQMRELLAPLKVDISAVEALAALKVAGRFVHLLQERWAEAHGLTEGRMRVLFRLYRCGDTPLGDLAENLESTPRNITGLVDHLERDGLVERVPDAEDRRSVRARLTEAGKTRIEATCQDGTEHQCEGAAAFSKGELAQLPHLVANLVESARKELGK